jgi:hypothetical protein
MVELRSTLIVLLRVILFVIFLGSPFDHGFARVPPFAASATRKRIVLRGTANRGDARHVVPAL